jgi:hypothetical protein
MVTRDPPDSTDRLRAFVERGLKGCGTGWREVLATYADERSFLELSAWRANSRERVLIEFGARDQDTRHRAGFLDTYWNPTVQQFEELQAVCLYGEAVLLERLVAEIAPFLGLPLGVFEVAEDGTPGQVG